VIAATILLCALGHLVRDGFPILNTTHGARALGGFLCTLGGFLLTWEWHGALLGFALYVGFYADMLHGEGQRGRGWVDVLPLIISGCTSLLPLGLASILINPFYGLVVFAGILKPLVWFGWWHLPIKWNPEAEFFVPTRMAAITWGALTGLLLSLA